MTKLFVLLGALMLGAGACAGPGEPSNCTCVAVGACTTVGAATEDCGIGLVCCPPVVDGG